MQAVSDEAAVVQRDGDVLCIGWCCEADRKSARAGSQDCRRQQDVGGTPVRVVPTQVWRRIYLDSEFRDVGVVGTRCQYRHLDWIRACDEQRAIQEQQSDRVIEAWNG